ncbi:DUF2513 domain-containing protein [Thiomonas sp.]
MQRNWTIIRQILLRLEQASTANTVLNANGLTEFDEQEVAYNMRLLKEAGFIEANILETRDGSGRIAAALARRLTNAGHDLLDTIRNDSVWAQVLKKFREKGIDMTFDLVLSVGKATAAAMLGL